MKKNKKKTKSVKTKRVKYNDLSSLSSSVQELKEEVSVLRTTLTKEPVGGAVTGSNLETLIDSQQKEAAKRLEEEVLPQARRAQSFYGYLTVSTKGDSFKMEKVESVARLEKILEGVKDGSLKVLMNPLGLNPAQAETSKKIEKVESVTNTVDNVTRTVVTKTTTEPTKKGFFSRLLGN